MPTYVDPLKPKVPVAQPIGGPTLQPAAPAVNAGFGGAPAQPVPQPAPAPVAPAPAPVRLLWLRRRPRHAPDRPLPRWQSGAVARAGWKTCSATA